MFVGIDKVCSSDLEGLSLPNHRNLREEGKSGREGGSGSIGDVVPLLLSAFRRAVVDVVVGFLEEGAVLGRA